MKCQVELESLVKFIKDNEQQIKEFYKRVIERHFYVRSPLEYLCYEVARFYCRNVYKEETYNCLYYKYNCDDSHILSLMKAGLKTIDIK